MDVPRLLETRSKHADSKLGQRCIRQLREAGKSSLTSLVLNGGIHRTDLVHQLQGDSRESPSLYPSQIRG